MSAPRHDPATSRRVPVVGRSMLPVLPPGVSVDVRPLAASPEPGAILVYRAGDRIVIHRLIRVSRDGDRVRYLTRGDASLNDDPPIDPACVLGEAVVVHTRWFSSRLDTPVRRRSGAIFSRATSMVRRATLWLR